MNQEKRSEVLAFFWFVVSALVLLSLLSYTPDDIPFEVSTPNSPTRNFVGITGAYTAWFLILLFGKTSYFLVPLFLFWALAKWSGKKPQRLWLKVFSTSVFLISACALSALLSGEALIERFQAGGALGFFGAGFLSQLFGPSGIFIALSLFLLSILLATELLVLQMAVGVFKKLRDVFLAGRAGKAPPLVKTGRPSLQTPAARETKPDVEPKAPLPSKLEIKFAASKPESKQEGGSASSPQGARAISKTRTSVENGSSRTEVLAAEAYPYPSLDLLQPPPSVDRSKLKEDLEVNSRVLEDTLRDFGIEAKVVEVEQGPVITRYELQPAAGVKVQRITSLENDISLAMRAASVRIVAPIPGKSRVGIEVPNSAASTVYLKEVLASPEFQRESSKVTVAIGKDTAGVPIVCNLADMPHLLIAGATNTGKSVCINSLLMSILFKASPEEVKFILVDPKMVELHFYNDLPHLLCPVLTDKSKVPGALNWLVAEMERRYELLSKAGAKNLLSFNEKAENGQISPEMLGVNSGEGQTSVVRKMPYIVIVIDELADLMIASAQEIESAITRLAQLARAVGIHIILATQRPSVDVITGVIKANFPARIAFQVASKVDSRTILDENGADKLLGRGDLLLMDPRKSKLVRAQGAWVQDSEIERVAQFIKSKRKVFYEEEIVQQFHQKAKTMGDFKRDEVYEGAKRLVLETGVASVSMVQRRLGLGYTRAARIMDMMEEEGVVGPYRGAKPREILVERPGVKEEEKR